MSTLQTVNGKIFQKNNIKQNTQQLQHEQLQHPQRAASGTAGVWTTAVIQSEVSLLVNPSSDILFKDVQGQTVAGTQA